MKKNVLNSIAIFISMVPAVYLLIVWSSLPSVVPLHFDGEMKPDRTGDKAELWFPVGIIALVSIGVYFLMNNLHRIDPKRVGNTQSGTFQKLSFGLVVFLAALNILIISSAKTGIVLQNFMFPLLGLLFAFIGNYMNNIKPNYFAGIRLPWTLSDDENWKKTHQLAGKLWFAGGLFIAVTSLFLPVSWVAPAFITITAILVLIPAVYSYKMFKRKTS